jgi:hypothetical protein
LGGVSTGPQINLGNSVIFNRIYLADGTVTLLNDLYCTDLLAAVSNIQINGNYKVYVSGNLRVFSAGNILRGTASIEMTGTGTFGLPVDYRAITSATTGPVYGINIIINTTGTITFYSPDYTALPTFYSRFYNGKTLTYTAGTLVNTANVSIAVTSTSYTFDINGTFKRFMCLTGVTGATFNDSIAFNEDFIVYENSTVNIADGKTLTINGSVYTECSLVTPVTIKASSGTAALNYNGTVAGQKLFTTTFTSIDASGSSVKVYTWHGTVTDCVNIKAVTGADIGGAGVTVTTV